MTARSLSTSARGDDLGGARAPAVDEHDTGSLGNSATAGHLVHRLLLVEAGDRADDDPSSMKTEARAHGLGEQAARVVAEVDDDALRALLDERLRSRRLDALRARSGKERSLT